MTSKRVPEIRFEGFSGDWEERKLGSLVEQVIREVPKPSEPYFRMSVRSHAKGTFRQFVDNPEKVAMDKLFVVRKNDLVINITFAWEHAIAVVPDRDDGLLVSHRFPTYRADGKSDIEFLHYMVSKEEFRQQLELISPGGAGRNRVLNKNNFLKLKVIVPNLNKEQEQIGNFFKQLDYTISLHQRNLDNLKTKKKGLLQKMFPKEGEKVPELRFPGFTDNWERAYLDKLILSIPAKNYITTSKKTGKFIVIQQGDVPISGYADGKPFEKYDKVLIFGDHTLSLYKPTSQFFVSTDGVKLITSNVVDVSYLAVLLRRYMPKSQGYKRHFTILKSEVVFYTTNFEEQQKIGQFFKQLDDKIALEERELKLLQETKKAFLQKMFV